MLRTCMTTAEMFKTHPNKSEIKFVILPFAKEGLHLCNDLAGPNAPVFAKFSDPSQCYGLNFDFSLFHNYGTEATWQFNIIGDLPALQKSYSCLKLNKAADATTYDINQANSDFLEEVYNQFPMRIEDPVTLYSRTRGVKVFLRNWLTHNTLGDG